MQGATRTARIGFLPKIARPARGRESTRATAIVRFVMAKEASWSYNLPFVVLGVKAAATEKCSVSGPEPSIVVKRTNFPGAGKEKS